MKTENRKHTPGPWRIWRDMDPKEPAQIVDPNIDGICVIDGLNTNAAANMALISAAPDMLSELRRVVSWLEQMQHAQRVGGSALEFLQHIDVADARAAIRKATGEQ